jgi:hypothetical protein
MASIIKYSWKIWLRPNVLTKDVDNNLIAEVSTNGKTLHNEDLAKRFIEEGSEIKYDTILSILNTRDRIVRTKLQERCQVQDGGHIKPRVPGTWIGANAKFNQEVNRPGLDIIETVETREALEQVGRTGTRSQGQRRLHRECTPYRYIRPDAHRGLML